METNSFEDFARRIVNEVIEMGVSQRTAWEEYEKVFLPIAALHKSRGKDEIDPAIVSDFVTESEKRLDGGEIGVAHYRRLKRGANRLLEYHRKGKMEWSLPKRVSKYALNNYFEKIVHDFLAASDYHQNTAGDVVWIARKYFSWLISEGHHDLCNVGAAEVQGFITHCSRQMKLGSVRNAKVYMKQLYRHLAGAGLSANDYEHLLSFPVVRSSRIFPAASPSDVAAILNRVDRRLPIGKRDYAIILLGAVTGLRAIDITRLKLSDIDWRRGEIKLVQEKTGNALALPLTRDVGQAIETYITEGRPDTKSEEVFIRDHRPYQAFRDPCSIGNMYDSYRQKAGLPRVPFDGNGFHSLRRGLGKNLVVAEVNINTAAQVFGDLKIDSMKEYIALDSVHLKECAISLQGIEPKGGLFA